MLVIGTNHAETDTPRWPPGPKLLQGFLRRAQRKLG